MADCIDRDMKVINLRAKLRAIEAKRADRSNVCKFNKCLARLKYPKTDSGRRRYIRDSLSNSCTPWFVEALICLLLLPFLIPIIIYAAGVWLWRRIRRHK